MVMFQFRPHARYKEEIDVLYVFLMEEAATRSEELDANRIIQQTGYAKPVHIEFHHASAGIDLTDVPEKERVHKLILESGKSFTIKGA